MTAVAVRREALSSTAAPTIRSCGARKDRRVPRLDPAENGDPRFRTEARRLRRAQSHPRSCLRPHRLDRRPLLSRRDAHAVEWLKVIIDGYHDRRTGMELGESCRREARLRDPERRRGRSVVDGVWARAPASTRSDGGRARVPLNQLRWRGRLHTFGFGIGRDVARSNERYCGRHRAPRAACRRSSASLGIDGIASPRRPRGGAAHRPRPPTRRSPSATLSKARDDGADVKYGTRRISRWTPPRIRTSAVEATVGPNLSAIETFFPRSAILPRKGLFRFDLNRNDGSCRASYSRCIGAADTPDAANPTTSTILGAAKLTGRPGTGLSVGVLDAVTQRETAPGAR